MLNEITHHKMAKDETVGGTLSKRATIDHAGEGGRSGQSTNRELAESTEHID